MGWRRVLVAAMAVAVGVLPGVARAEPADPPPFRAMLDRPLFSPNRRPPPPPLPFPTAAPAAAPIAPPSPLPPDVSLSGVIAGGGGGVALLKRPGDATPVRVAPGGQVDGWTLAEIRARAVVLRRDGRSVTVDLPGAR